MNFKQYRDVNEFYDATYDLLMTHETQNNIMLGNIVMGKAGKNKSEWRDPANWFMATIFDNIGIQLIALMTPPHGITLYARDNKIDETAIKCLVDNITDIPVPGVVAKKDIAECFAQIYSASNKMTCETAMEQRIYELTAVNLDIADIGTIRLAEERDMYFLPYWLEGMYAAFDGLENITMNIPQDVEPYLNRFARQKLFILEVDGQPVSMAATSRELQTVCGVAVVYTPPYFRGKGYASSCVAKVSQFILDRGFTKCVLYTDLANPTSNSIYQKIGYQPVCDSVMLKFV